MMGMDGWEDFENSPRSSLVRSGGLEGLEKNISHQQMADLIAFIKNWRYLDGRTPGTSSTE